MFEDEQNQGEPTVDIFAGTDPAAETQGVPGQPPGPGSGEPLPEIQESKPASKKLVLVAIVVVLVVVVLIAVLVGFWLVRRGEEPVTPTQPVVTTPVVPELLEFSTEPVIAEPEIEPEPIDTDGDGLTDAEEISLGTSPIVADSDDDGLSDFEEVRTWLTDPLLADTDGDGFNDGDEVAGGFDPKRGGGAKLLEDLGGTVGEGDGEALTEDGEAIEEGDEEQDLFPTT